MLLILEIVLTIAAWRRGWKGWALLPTCVGFIIVLLTAFAGAPEDGIMGMGIILDLVCIATLIGMVIKPHRKTQTHESVPTNEVKTPVTQ